MTTTLNKNPSPAQPSPAEPLKHSINELPPTASTKLRRYLINDTLNIATSKPKTRFCRGSSRNSQQLAGLQTLRAADGARV